MKMRDLLKRSYDELEIYVKDERCDHSVNICFCSTFQLLSEIDFALKRSKESRSTVRPKRAVQQAKYATCPKCKKRFRYTQVYCNSCSDVW
jgi:hypothetical protein